MVCVSCGFSKSIFYHNLSAVAFSTYSSPTEYFMVQILKKRDLIDLGQVTLTYLGIVWPWPWVKILPLTKVYAWRIPGTEEPGELQFIGSQRVEHDWSDLANTQDVWEMLQGTKHVSTVCMKEEWLNSVIDVSGTAL